LPIPRNPDAVYAQLLSQITNPAARLLLQATGEVLERFVPAVFESIHPEPCLDLLEPTYIIAFDVNGPLQKVAF
jgi:hypothetical protein